MGKLKLLANHLVVRYSTQQIKHGPADENYMWIDEEIRLFLHVVLDYKVGKVGEGVGKETVYHDFANWFCVKFDFKQSGTHFTKETNCDLATFLLSKQR